MLYCLLRDGDNARGDVRNGIIIPGTYFFSYFYFYFVYFMRAVGGSKEKRSCGRSAAADAVAAATGATFAAREMDSS